MEYQHQLQIYHSILFNFISQENNFILIKQFNHFKVRFIILKVKKEALFLLNKLSKFRKLLVNNSNHWMIIKKNKKFNKIKVY